MARAGEDSKAVSRGWRSSVAPGESTAVFFISYSAPYLPNQKSSSPWENMCFMSPWGERRKECTLPSSSTPLL